MFITLILLLIIIVFSIYLIVSPLDIKEKLGSLLIGGVIVFVSLAVAAKFENITIQNDNNHTEEQKKMELERVLNIIENRLTPNFAYEKAEEIIKENLHNELFYIAFTSNDPKTQWISAYILEKIYFKNPHIFTLFEEDFIINFSNTTNDGAKRHYSKIAYYIIDSYNS